MVAQTLRAKGTVGVSVSSAPRRSVTASFCVAILAAACAASSPATGAALGTHGRDTGCADAGSVGAPSAAGSPDPVVTARLVGPGVGWVLTQHSLKRTTDDGRTWT